MGSVRHRQSIAAHIPRKLKVKVAVFGQGEKARIAGAQSVQPLGS